MNYDHFEREILGYQGEMRRRAERNRILWAGSTREHATRHPARSRLSGGLRNLSNRLRNVSEDLSNRFHAPPAHLF